MGSLVCPNWGNEHVLFLPYLAVRFYLQKIGVGCIQPKTGFLGVRKRLAICAPRDCPIICSVPLNKKTKSIFKIESNPIIPTYSNIPYLWKQTWKIWTCMNCKNCSQPSPWGAASQVLRFCINHPATCSWKDVIWQRIVRSNGSHGPWTSMICLLKKGHVP